MQIQLSSRLLLIVFAGLFIGCADDDIDDEVGEDVGDTFGFLDDDADGLITMEEFEEDLERFESDLTFTDVDSDDDSFLDRAEFDAFEAELGNPSMEGTGAFGFFDDDLDSFVNEAEFDEEIGRFEDGMAFADIEEEFDSDVDGLFNAEEFGAFETEFGPFESDFGF